MTPRPARKPMLYARLKFPASRELSREFEKIASDCPPLAVLRTDRTVISMRCQDFLLRAAANFLSHHAVAVLLASPMGSPFVAARHEGRSPLQAMPCRLRPRCEPCGSNPPALA